MHVAARIAAPSVRADYLQVIADRVAAIEVAIRSESGYVLAMDDEATAAHEELTALSDKVRALVYDGAPGSIDDIIGALEMFSVIGDEVRVKVDRLRAVMKTCGDGARAAVSRIRDMKSELEALKLRRAEAEAFMGVEPDANSG